MCQCGTGWDERVVVQYATHVALCIIRVWKVRRSRSSPPNCYGHTYTPRIAARMCCQSQHGDRVGMITRAIILSTLGLWVQRPITSIMSTYHIVWAKHPITHHRVPHRRVATTYKPSLSPQQKLLHFGYTPYDHPPTHPPNARNGPF